MTVSFLDGDSSDLKRCERCQQFWYCDVHCQRQDWQSFHKMGECRFYKRVFTSPTKAFFFKTTAVLQNSFLLHVRTYFLLKSDPGCKQRPFTMHDGSRRSLSDVRLQPNSAMMEYCAGAIAVFSSLDHSIDRQLLCQTLVPMCFADDVYPQDMETVGEIGSPGSSSIALAFYVQLTSLTHSCAPNASVVYSGRELQVRAMKPIAAGEAVTISLVDVMWPRARRQQQLSLQYNIECSCDRCTGCESMKEQEDLTYYEQRVHPLAIVIMFHKRYGNKYDPNVTFMLLRHVTRMERKLQLASVRCWDVTEVRFVISRLSRLMPVTHGRDSLMWSCFQSVKQRLLDKGFNLQPIMHADDEWDDDDEYEANYFHAFAQVLAAARSSPASSCPVS